MRLAQVEIQLLIASRDGFIECEWVWAVGPRQTAEDVRCVDLDEVSQRESANLGGLCISRFLIDFVARDFEKRFERSQACPHCTQMGDGMRVGTRLSHGPVDEPRSSAGPTASRATCSVPEARPVKI